MEPNGSIVVFKLQSSVILSVDSRLVKQPFLSVMDNHYDKLIQMYPRVFLGCLAEKEVCEALKTKFPIDPFEFTPKSLVEVANLVKDAVNFFMEDRPSKAEIVLVGAVNDDDEPKIYKISKENHSWKHRVDEVVEDGVVIAGTGVDPFLRMYVDDNPFNPDMTEEEGIMYGFEGIKFAGESDWCSGGDIQVVAVNKEPDGFKRRKWTQDDPGNCLSEYHRVPVPVPVVV